MAKRRNKRQQIEAKPTSYGGVTFRSRLEARWAVFFDHAGNVLNWQYEPLTWSLSNGWTYTPDFALFMFLEGVKDTLYVEVKPTPPTKEYLSTLNKFARNYKPVILLQSSLFPDSVGALAVTCSVVTGAGQKALLPTRLFYRFPEAIEFAVKYRFDI